MCLYYITFVLLYFIGRRPRQDPYWPTTPDEPPARGTVPSSLGAGGTGGAYFQRQSSDPYRGVEG